MPFVQSAYEWEGKEVLVTRREKGIIESSARPASKIYTMESSILLLHSKRTHLRSLIPSTPPGILFFSSYQCLRRRRTRACARPDTVSLSMQATALTGIIEISSQLLTPVCPSGYLKGDYRQLTDLTYICARCIARAPT